jgi:hypothetical protein
VRYEGGVRSLAMTDRRWPTLGLVVLCLASACGHGAAKSSSGTEVTQTTGAAAQAAAPAKVEPAKTEPAKAKPSMGRAVVRSGARLYYASTGDISVVLPPLEGAPGVAVDVVGEQDGRLVIETLGSEPADYHCSAVMDGLRHVRVRFYVAKDELLPVLTTEHEHDFGDGTAVRLAPGVPVPPGAAALLVRGTPVRVPVPAERIGRVYVPRPPFPTGGDGGRLHPVGRDDGLRYGGGEPLAEEHLYRDGPAVLHYLTMPRERDVLVVVRNACLEVVAAAPAERLRPSPPSPTLGAKHGEDPLDDEDVWKRLIDEHRLAEKAKEEDGIVHVVEDGAAIQWVDGSPAGWATGKHRLMQTRYDVDGRACFDVPLLTTENAAVVLCFAAEDVLSFGHPRPSSIGRSNRLPANDGSRSSGFGGRGKALPRVRQGKAKHEGPLDGDIIRRIVRAHINEVRACYMKGLALDAALAGSISIRLKIGSTGKVKSASVVDTTLADPTVSQCIVTAFERMKFPKSPNERATLVILPLVLEPA